MNQELFRMKLYLYMQNFKELIHMPYLETVCDKGLSEISFLEEKLMTKKAGLLVHDTECHLMNLLEEKYLYKSNHSSSFLSNNHILLLKHQIITDNDKKSQDDYTDIVVYVIANDEDVKNAVWDIEHMRHEGELPLMMFLFDSDGEADIEKCRQNIEVYFKYVGYTPFQPDEITYIAYSSSKAIQAQKLMDNQLMQESNFFAAKQKLQKISQLALMKHLLTRCFYPFLALLDMCKEKMEGLAGSHREDIGRLQKIKQDLEAIPLGFHDTIRQNCKEACCIYLEPIELEVKPDNTAMARNIVTGIINEKIQTVFEPKANNSITDALNIVESGYNSFFSQLTKNLFWMKNEDKVMFGENLSLLKIDQKTFRFPEFRMNINDFLPIVSSMELSEVNQIIKDTVQKAMDRYDTELKNTVSKWLDSREEQYISKIRELIQMLEDTIVAAIEEHNQYVDLILTSDTYTLLKNIISEVKNLEGN